MALRKYPTDIIEQASAVLTACRQIDVNLRAGKLSQDEFADSLTLSQQQQGEIDATELQLVSMRNRRDDDLAMIWDTVKRIRSMVKAVYGDDSSEYELVGGTRASDRKRPVRRTRGSSQNLQE